MKNPIFISGPSGVGKSYLTRYLVKYFLCEKVITTTTRQQRQDEVQEVHYHFVSNNEFDQLEKTGQLCISDRLLNASYGLRQSLIERIITNGKTPICEAYGPHITLFTQAFPNAHTIYLIPENLELLERRMRQRRDSESKITVRIESAKEELKDYYANSRVYFEREYLVKGDDITSIVHDLTSNLWIHFKPSIY